MLPKLEEFDVQPPAYIRKIDSRTHWNPENCENENERVQKVVERVFRDEIYSIWLVNSALDFYGVIASLSARRNPKNQAIDFICITRDELDEVGIKLDAVEEGKCLDVQNLHFNARIDKDRALKLCGNLILREDRKAQRCQKTKTQLILEHQESRGCKATDTHLEKCQCEDRLEGI